MKAKKKSEEGISHGIMLEWYRKWSRLTQRQLAEKVRPPGKDEGLSEAYISKLERGEEAGTRDTIEAILWELGRDLEEYEADSRDCLEARKSSLTWLLFQAKREWLWIRRGVTGLDDAQDRKVRRMLRQLVDYGALLIPYLTREREVFLRNETALNVIVKITVVKWMEVGDVLVRAYAATHIVEEKRLFSNLIVKCYGFDKRVWASVVATLEKMVENGELTAKRCEEEKAELQRAIILAFGTKAFNCPA